MKYEMTNPHWDTVKMLNICRCQEVKCNIEKANLVNK